MLQRLITVLLVVALPGSASAGPIRDAIEKAAAQAAAQQDAERPRSRWLSWGLIAGGGVMTTLGLVELGDDETGPDDGEDFDDSDDGEDSDGWGRKAMLGGGIAAAALGGVLLLTGRGPSPNVTIQPKRVTIRHTVKF